MKKLLLECSGISDVNVMRTRKNEILLHLSMTDEQIKDNLRVLEAMLYDK